MRPRFLKVEFSSHVINRQPGFDFNLSYIRNKAATWRLGYRHFGMIPVPKCPADVLELVLNCLGSEHISEHIGLTVVQKLGELSRICNHGAEAAKCPTERCARVAPPTTGGLGYNPRKWLKIQLLICVFKHIFHTKICAAFC